MVRLTCTVLKGNPYKPSPCQPETGMVIYLVLLLVFILKVDVQAQPVEQAQTRPNIVVLVADDTRWDALGVSGNEIIQTPRLDQLSNEGVRFTHAYVTTSICWVSRASILTGQYMSRHTRTMFNHQLSPEAFADSYPALLRNAGYWTGWIGKWHNGQIRVEDFDFARTTPERHWLDDPEHGRIHVTEKHALDAIEFLRQRPKDRPFLLNVAYFAPHAEDAAPEQYLPQAWSAKYYDGVEIPETSLSADEFFDVLPEFLKHDANEGRIRYQKRFDTPARFQLYMTNYFRLITEVDEAVGRLMDELKAQGLYENTLILFIGDNGYFYGDRGLADKWYPYEQSIRVPLVIRDPRLRQGGAVRDEMVLNIDVAPTILAAAGLQTPDGIQGVDLAPLYLSNKALAWRDEFFYAHPTITSKNRIPSSFAVVRKDKKYVLYPEWEYEQLFDLREDPSEKHNLVGDPDYQDELAIMRKKLEEWQVKAR